MIYAETHSSFEAISLKFLQDLQIEALKMFLKKVKTYKLNSNEVHNNNYNFTI